MNDSRIDNFQSEWSSLIKRDRFVEARELCQEVLASLDGWGDGDEANRSRLGVLSAQYYVDIRRREYQAAVDTMKQAVHFAANLQLDLYDQCSLKMKTATSLALAGYLDDAAENVVAVLKMCSERQAWQVFGTFMSEFQSDLGGPERLAEVMRRTWALLSKPTRTVKKGSPQK